MSVNAMLYATFPENLIFITPVDQTDNMYPTFKDDGLERIKKIWQQNPGLQLSSYLSSSSLNAPKFTPLKSKEDAVKSLSKKILQSVRTNFTVQKQLLADITNQTE